MSGYAGDVRLGDTHDYKFTTRQISGAPFTLAGSPVISAYPGNSTTELTAGITLTVDFDGRTGYNNIRVVGTGGNGYATATDYDLSLTAGTVNAVSVVGESVAAFSIENRSALMPVTAGRAAVVDAAGLIDANAVKIGPTGAGTAQTAGDVGVKTGFALSAGGIQAIWDALTAALTTAGSIGKWIVDKLDVVLSTGIQARLPAALTGAGNMKSDALALNGSTAAAAMLAILNGATVVYSGTVTGAATTTTLIDSGLTQADVDWWKGRIVIFTSVITQQATDITAFDPVTDKLTFTAVTQAPTGATFVII
jgi:hypothetical protein